MTCYTSNDTAISMHDSSNKTSPNILVFDLHPARLIYTRAHFSAVLWNLAKEIDASIVCSCQIFSGPAHETSPVAHFVHTGRIAKMSIEICC